MDKQGGQNQLKVFTIEEANQLLPKLNPLLRQLQEKRKRILSLEVEIDTLELVAEKDEDGFSPSLNKKVDEYTKAVSSFYVLIEEVHDMGCFLKDLDTGLVDFYALYHGRKVYLCWKLGESKVDHWHEVGKGFSSRELLDSGS